MKVTVEIPARVWGRLASVADSRGVKVAALIGDAVEGLLVLETDGQQPLHIPAQTRRHRDYQSTTEQLVVALRLGRLDMIRALLAREGMTAEAAENRRTA